MWFDEHMTRDPLPPGASVAEIARRIVATREALGLRSVDVCNDLGFRSNMYAQWESGDRRPNLDDMIRFCARYGLTLDWIYRGDMSGLQHGLATKLRQLAS